MDPDGGWPHDAVAPGTLHYVAGQRRYLLINTHHRTYGRHHRRFHASYCFFSGCCHIMIQIYCVHFILPWVLFCHFTMCFSSLCLLCLSFIMCVFYIMF